MIWRRHPKYRKYAISKCGKVKNVRTGLILTPWKVATGYDRVELCKIKGFDSCYVHRLVAETFLFHPKGKNEVNHKNGIKDDNRVENLEWTDRNGNMAHYAKNKTKKKFLYEVYDTESEKGVKFNTIAAIARYMNVSYDTVNYMIHGTIAPPQGIEIRRIT